MVKNIIPKIGLVVGVVAIITLNYFYWQQNNSKTETLNTKITNLEIDKNKALEDLVSFQSVDQVIINNNLTTEIKSIYETYNLAIETYNKLTDLRDGGNKTRAYEVKFAEILKLLGDKKYLEAKDKTLVLENELDKKIKEVAIASIPKIDNLPVNNVPPQAGYNRQKVAIDGGEFVVDIITVDLTKNRIIVDTASDGDCKNDCPVKSLADFVARSGGWAGINGPYFCPATYPACTDKKNTFDTLIMNKNKTYFNSENNVYSSVPAVVFSTTSRFLGKTADWGRDTGVDSVIAGQPLLVWDGQSRFGGDGDPKKSSIGSRVFIGATDNTTYLGIIRNVSVAQASQVIAKMGIKYAINLDSGGSTAMMANGKYVAGPGRDTPFGIVVIRR